MRAVPFEIIKAAKENDIEAAETIKRFFEGYIASRSLQSCEDQQREEHKVVDEDLRYWGELALLASIFQFQFKDPPDNFRL